jgi:uncharacterized protein YlxW (UPF0749 family)
MKGKRGRAFLIFVFALLFGLLLQSQMGVSGGQKLYVSAKTLDYYNTNLETERRETEALKLQVEAARAKLDELEATLAESGESYDAYVADLQSQIAYASELAGQTDLRGPGVKIVIDDSTGEATTWDVNDLLVHDQDLLTIVNDLKTAGAEAISINGQRLVGSSAISCSGYTVRINGVVYATPFVILAIGDSARMAETMLGPTGYGTLLTEVYGLQFRLSVENEIVIPAYRGSRYCPHLTVVKEGTEL